MKKDEIEIEVDRVAVVGAEAERALAVELLAEGLATLLINEAKSRAGADLTCAGASLALAPREEGRAPSTRCGEIQSDPLREWAGGLHV